MKFDQKKLADVPREIAKMADEVEVVVRLEMVWLNGRDGQIIESYSAINCGVVETEKMKLAGGSVLSDLGAEMIQRIVVAFRMAHGQAVLSRALQLVADARAGLLQVVRRGSVEVGGA